MDKKTEIDNILVLLKSWIAEIKFNSKLEYYDINKISEGLSANILNLIFGYKLKDLNKEKKNFPGIDLGDKVQDKIAFQVTSRTDFRKFKESVEAFVKKGKDGKSLADTFTNGIKFLVISIEEIKSGKTDLAEICPNFNFKSDILRVADLLPFIADLYDNDISCFKLVKQALEEQFTNKGNVIFSSKIKEQFLKEYEKIIINNFSRINFFGLDLPRKPREIQLYSLFVEPRFKPFKDNPNNYNKYFDNKLITLDFESEVVIPFPKINDIDNNLFRRNDLITELQYPFNQVKDISLSALFESINYSNDLFSFFSADEKMIPYKNLFKSKRSKIIIGNPGAGKSLLVKQAMCKILSKDLGQFESNYVYETIPFRIELFKFNKDRKGNGIEYYLYNNLKNTLGLSWITDELIFNILTIHETLVFFDGLDEIFDIHERIEVRDLIENFTNKYDKSISIVTSRFESYEEVSFPTITFDTIEILDFDEGQIHDYVHKWYDIEEANETTRIEEVKNCLDQLSRVDKELINSPLLLSLILILYRNQLDIPTTKLEIYESCANTLIETRDVKEKKLDLNFQIKNKVAAFAHIAYWQFNKQNGAEQQKDINYASVMTELKKYLLLQFYTSFEDDHAATVASKEFLDYAKNRSIYVENNFTHKSFLEYFTAYYLYSNFYYKGKHEYIHEIITENINKSSWFVVLELLICKIDSGQPDYDIIDDIIERQILQNEINAVTFYAQILQQIRNISSNKIDDLISRSIQLIVNQKTDNSTAIFDSLIHLATLDRFRSIVQNQFSQIIANLNEDKEEVNPYYQVNLEANIASINGNALGIEHKFNITKDPYSFILEVYPSLLDWSKYFEVLKYFTGKFGPDHVRNVYYTVSRTKIFYGKSYFNWILSCLFSFNDQKQFLRNYGKLKSLGFNSSEIAQIAKNKHFEISQDLLNKYYNVKDQSINKLLNQISKNRYNITCEEYKISRNKFFNTSKLHSKFHK